MFIYSISNDHDNDSSEEYEWYGIAIYNGVLISQNMIDLSANQIFIYIR